MGYNYSTNRRKFYDPNGYIKACRGNRFLIDLVRDSWDILYGKPPYEYEVYALTNSLKPICLNIGLYLLFTHEPFYVGHGVLNKRIIDSSALGRQLDKQTQKVFEMIDIIRNKGGRIRGARIGKFYTKEKASTVEKKVIRLIHGTYPGMLKNSLYNSCQIPLTFNDCNIMCEPGICLT